MQEARIFRAAVSLMHESIFRGLRAAALSALLFIGFGLGTTAIYCFGEFEGPIGSATYLDAVCPLEEPRSSFEGNALNIVFNKLAGPIFLGIALLLTCAMLAVWVALFVPNDEEPHKPKRPGRPQDRTRNQRTNGPGGEGAPPW